MLANTSQVVVCFKMSTENAASPRIVYAWCDKCAGGENSGWCHHVVTLVIGLMQLRMGIIKAGQYNGGDRAWGHHRLLTDMPSLESSQIALLFPSQHALCMFPGIKTKFANMRYVELD